MLKSTPPEHKVKLIFVHHSCGRNWLMDELGGLSKALTEINYFVSDTNYQWGPHSIGDHTDIGDWWTWFRGDNCGTYLEALLNESGQHSEYTRSEEIIVGENEIIMFKSCYPNSRFKGDLSAAIPRIEDNPLKGQNCGSEHHTVSNAKGIYIDLLEFFKTRQDKLFVVITAPPVLQSEAAAQARHFNQWLVHDWLKDYPYHNVRVFDFFNVLTSNAGDDSRHDADASTGNHHRIVNGQIEHTVQVDCNTEVYPRKEGDNHPSAVGNTKATIEFVPLLNSYYHTWKASM